MNDDDRLGFGPMILLTGIAGLFHGLMGYLTGEPAFYAFLGVIGFIAFCLIIGKVTGCMDGEIPGPSACWYEDRN